MTSTYRYRLPAGAPSISHSYSFNALPAGTYHVSYTTLWTNDANVACWIQASAANTVHEAFGYNTANSANSANAASGIVTTTAAAPLLVCQNQSGAANAIYSEDPNFPSTVVFTKVDTSVNSTATGSRPGLPARSTP